MFTRLRTMASSDRTKYAFAEVRRLLVPIVALLIATYFLDHYGVKNAWALRLHKINQVTFYIVLAHMVRSEIFPYLDLGRMYREDDPAFGSVFIGIAIFMAAIVLGGTLGL